MAYALARLRWKGRNAALVLILASMMLPQQVTVVPLYVMFAKIHLVGTLWPLILPNFFGDAFSIFLLRQFFLTIPEEYSDAARVDGCGELRVMLSVVTRLAKPALAAVALFSFLYCWNDFFGPLLYTGENQGHWTLSVGLSQFRTVHDRIQHATGRKARLIGNEHRCASVPWCEEAAVGMLRPARRRNVQVHVARQHAQLVHRG